MPPADEDILDLLAPLFKDLPGRLQEVIQRQAEASSALASRANGDPPFDCGACGLPIPAGPYHPASGGAPACHAGVRGCLEAMRAILQLAFEGAIGTCPPLEAASPPDGERRSERSATASAQSPVSESETEEAAPLLHRAVIHVDLEFAAEVRDITPERVRRSLRTYANYGDLVAPGDQWAATWVEAAAQRRLLHALLADPAARDRNLAKQTGYEVDVWVNREWQRSVAELEPVGGTILAPALARLVPEDQHFFVDSDPDLIVVTEQLAASIVVTFRGHRILVEPV